MKKLVFVIQLIFLYSSLAMADPVISLKTLLHEMTDRSALARWPVGPKIPIRASSSAATTVVRII